MRIGHVQPRSATSQIAANQSSSQKSHHHSMHAAKAASTQHVALKMYMGTSRIDGKMHALATNADFTVKAGEPVTLTITNIDSDMTHSFTAPDFHIDEQLPPGKGHKPTVRTITFTPSKAGTFEWHCSVPCDPKAMATDGMMRGTITVK